MISDAPKRPALRYHGGKWRIAPWIISYFPSHRVYVEPYAGAASVLLRKPRSYAEVYNDLDGEIVNLFRVLRDPAQARELERLLRLTPFAREEFVSAYLLDGDPMEQARRTIIKSFMGHGSDGITGEFGTGFRANSNRSGTTPAHDWANFPDQIAFFCQRLSGIVIESRPAIDVITKHDSKDTLIYADPPYPMDTRGRDHIHRYRFEMSHAEHRELAGVLRSATGYVVLSGYACDLYQELYPDWHQIKKSAHADGAKDRVEVLWLSPPYLSGITGRCWPAPVWRQRIQMTRTLTATILLLLTLLLLLGWGRASASFDAYLHPGERLVYVGAYYQGSVVFATSGVSWLVQIWHGNMLAETHYLPAGAELDETPARPRIWRAEDKSLVVLYVRSDKEKIWLREKMYLTGVVK